MNPITLTYYPNALNANLSSTLVGITFTGKEKDAESGYHYFGARYYDSEALTGWLSVDPMADKYPGLSPYNYCAWNPVKLVDPDGRDWYRYTDNDGNVQERWFKTSTFQYKDNEGNTWENIGTDRVTIQNNVLTHQYQSIDENGEYHLHTKKYSGHDVCSDFLNLLGLQNCIQLELVGNTTFSFRYDKNVGNYVLKFYDSGWKGGTKVHIKTFNLGKLLAKTGYTLGALSSAITIYEVFTANSVESTVQSLKDLTATSIGYLPGCKYVPAVWFCGVRKLEQVASKMSQRVIMTTMKSGRNPGDIEFMPFK